MAVTRPPDRPGGRLPEPSSPAVTPAVRIRQMAIELRGDIIRETGARRRLRAERLRFFSNPVNLLLPFTAGALVAARNIERRPPGKTRAKTSMLNHAITLITAGAGLYRRYRKDAALINRIS